MFAFLIVAFSAFCSTQANGLSQKINDLHLHAKYGRPFTDSDVIKVGPIEEEISPVAEAFVKEKIPKDPYYVKAKYGPIEDVDIPGFKLSSPINLTNIRISGLKDLHFSSFICSMGSNLVEFIATVPFIVLDVTFENVQIEVDQRFGGKKFNTNIRLSVRLVDLKIAALASFDQIEDILFIDQAEVDINARETLFEINIQQGLEEVRYALSELCNNSLDDIMDSVLKVVVEEINNKLLDNVSIIDIYKYLYTKLPEGSPAWRDLYSITKMFEYAEYTSI